MDSREWKIEPALDGTCKWLSMLDEYRTWKGSQQSLLWIQGKVGVGKSTLLKRTLLDLKAAKLQGSVVAGFFFDRYRGQATSSALSLYRSLLHQLLSQSHFLLMKFLPRFRAKYNRSTTWKWEFQELRDAFLAMATHARSPRIYIFVDALDECDNQYTQQAIRDFEQALEFAAQSGNSLKICFSSRQYPTYLSNCSLIIQVENNNAPDIEKYTMEKLQIPSQAGKYLRNTVIARASGMFWWVVLVIEALVQSHADGNCITRIKCVIYEVPSQIESELIQIFQEIHLKYRTETVRLMRYVLRGEQDLFVSELKDALASGNDTSLISCQQCIKPEHPVTEEQMERWIRSRSGGLIEVKWRYASSFLSYDFDGSGASLKISLQLLYERNSTFHPPSRQDVLTR